MLQVVDTFVPGHRVTLDLVEQAARDMGVFARRPEARTPEATMRRVLQELRDEGYIKFVDNDGIYTLEV
jgi:DNA-binding IclR family transcriptional regulator